MFNDYVEIVFLASSFASTSPKKWEEESKRWWEHCERMSKLGREHWIFHTQDYMQNTCLVSRQARISYTCGFVSWFTCVCASLQQFVKLTVTWLCVGVLIVFVRTQTELMLRFPQDAADVVCVCVCETCRNVWHCVILQIRKTCHWVKSH